MKSASELKPVGGSRELKVDSIPGGWIPIPLMPRVSEIRAGSTIIIQAFPQIPVRGPYLFAFENRDDLYLRDIRIGVDSLFACTESISFENLIANCESAEPGDRFFPIEGPSMFPGQAISVEVFNDSKDRIKVCGTIYAQKGNE